jgi:hypothetical protein
MKIIYLLIILGLFTSCIEIWDDLTLNNDGTGTLRYKINLSESKVTVNSIFALGGFQLYRTLPKQCQGHRRNHTVSLEL